jgi:hypothetical protein
MYSLPMPLQCVRRALAGCALALGLAGCGGGVFVGINDRLDSRPPTVSLAGPSTAMAGQLVRLTAAAADDHGVEQVAFYRVEGTGEVRLAIDENAPYEIETTMPLTAPATLRFFARAIDVEGNLTQSSTIIVQVTP